MNRAAIISLKKAALMLAALPVATTALAHHGWGGYSREIRATMTVTEVEWRNPHDLVFATDAEGTKWTLLLAPPIRNRKFGFGPGTVNVGDVVNILGAGHPTKAEAKVHTITRADGTEVYRYLYTENTDSQEKIGGITQQPRSENSLAR